MACMIYSLVNMTAMACIMYMACMDEFEKSVEMLKVSYHFSEVVVCLTGSEMTCANLQIVI